MSMLLSRSAARQRLLVVCLSTLCMSLAIALRHHVNIWLTTGLSAALALALCLSVYGTQLRRLAVPYGRQVCLGIAYGLLMVALTELAYPIGTTLFPGLSAWVAPLYANLRQPPGPYLALPILTLVVVAEECVWRGLLIDMLQQRYQTLRVVLLSTAIYAIPHLGSGSWLLLGVVVVCGVIWSSQRLMTGSLVVPFITHLVWDLGVFVIFPLE